MNTLITSVKYVTLCMLFMAFAFAPGLIDAADDIASYEPPTWKGNVTLGGNYQTGNTDRINAAIGADALRKSDKERYTLNFLFSYSEEDGKNTATL